MLVICVCVSLLSYLILYNYNNAVIFQDVYYPEVTLSNQDEIRFIYCTHTINHIIKGHMKILHHNAKLRDRVNVPEEFRDQGLVRPRVLIVVPFKSFAYRYG